MSAHQPEKLLYAPTHEWVAVERDSQGGRVATIGISAFAVEALTDLVFLQLPDVGQQLTAGQSFGEVESVKAVSDLYAPVSGEVVAVNSLLPDHLEWLSQEPFGKGWVLKVKVSDDSDLQKLMDHTAYQKQCAEEGH